jgi:hypothetical protein
MPVARSGRAAGAALGALVLKLLLADVAAAQPCPSSLVQFTQAPAQTLVGPTVTGSGSDGYFGVARWHFRDFGDSVAFSLSGGGGNCALTVHASYRFLGLPDGTPVSNVVRAHVTGGLSGYGGDPCNFSNAQFSLLDDGVVQSHAVWSGQREAPPSDNCSRVFVSDQGFNCQHPAGTEFDLAQKIQLLCVQGLREDAAVSATLSFTSIPPGAFLVRCDGDTALHVVGVGASPSASLQIDALWPNPTSGEFRAVIHVPAGGPALSGRLVESRVWDASTASRRELAFGRSLPPGNYFLQVRQGAVTTVRPVVVRH